ncbi:hypothetical protein bhn_II012 (plasmid) [Butyrivibrio hungatei]|uniref:Uncharacterized protein n=1 Tax=Butyrivibrio hungatei TaxID=185008 RepID=A0A1D9P5K0_9FIRM|nr:hypothetical protein bhn_II012 [Butyrivibrio hungatei]
MFIYSKRKLILYMTMKKANDDSKGIWNNANIGQYARKTFNVDKIIVEMKKRSKIENYSVFYFDKI